MEEDKTKEQSQKEGNTAELKPQITDFRITGFGVVPKRLVPILPPSELHSELRVDPSGKNFSKN